MYRTILHQECTKYAEVSLYGQAEKWNISGINKFIMLWHSCKRQSKLQKSKADVIHSYLPMTKHIHVGHT